MGELRDDEVRPLLSPQQLCEKRKAASSADSPRVSVPQMSQHVHCAAPKSSAEVRRITAFLIWWPGPKATLSGSVAACSSQCCALLVCIHVCLCGIAIAYMQVMTNVLSKPMTATSRAELESGSRRSQMSSSVMAIINVHMPRYRLLSTSIRVGTDRTAGRNGSELQEEKP